MDSRAEANAARAAGFPAFMASAVQEPVAASVRTAWEALRGEEPDLNRVARRLAKLLTVTAVASALIGGFEALAEHYRGSFNQWSMWTPVGASAALLGASAAALKSRRAFRRWLPAASWLTVADGLAGVFYHVRGIHRRPGGFRHSTFNIPAGAPLFAPLILSGAGAIGILAALLDRSAEAQSRRQPGALPHEPAA